MERSARCARREFTFHGGKDAFDQRAQGIELGWEMLAHLKAHTGGPATGAALGRYYAVGFELLAAEGMVAFGIELGVGQHAADGRVPMCTAHQRRQRGTVIPRCLPRPLGQNQLPFQVHHGQPLQPVFPGALGLAKVLHAANEVAAHRALCQACGVDAYRDTPSPPPGHAPHHLVQGAIYIVGLQPRQEAIQRGVVGNRAKVQGRAQLAVFAKPHLSFAEGPVFIAQQAEYGQKLRLGKHALAELGSLRRQHHLVDFESQPGKPHQSYFGHIQFAKTPEQLQRNAVSAAFRATAPRMSTEPPSV